VEGVADPEPPPQPDRAKIDSKLACIMQMKCVLLHFFIMTISRYLWWVTCLM
jgi:hypothetical protein